jgi:hypothetical protein
MDRPPVDADGGAASVEELNEIVLVRGATCRAAASAAIHLADDNVWRDGHCRLDKNPEPQTNKKGGGADVNGVRVKTAKHDLGSCSCRNGIPAGLIGPILIKKNKFLSMYSFHYAGGLVPPQVTKVFLFVASPRGEFATQT